MCAGLMRCDESGNTIRYAGLMRVYGAPLLTLGPVSQMIPDARHEVAPLALASRQKDRDDAPFLPFLLP